MGGSGVLWSSFDVIAVNLRTSLEEVGVVRMDSLLLGRGQGEHGLV